MTGQNMIVAMLFAGALSTMSVWAASPRDVRWSVNDLYMIGLMTGWTLLFYGLLAKHTKQALVGMVIVVAMLVAIRTQALISWRQFVRGMIPHHSMAILMSKRQLEIRKDLSDEQRRFLEDIITTQQAEIDWMKREEVK